ncbi:hypothetical protein ACOMHN_025679 [Nucella lapillus]
MCASPRLFVDGVDKDDVPPHDIPHHCILYPLCLHQEMCASPRLFVDGVDKDDVPPHDIPHHYILYHLCLHQEICASPRLFVDGVDKDDVRQGDLGNCWFVAALSCLTSVKQYWHKVIPDDKDQDWNDEKPEEYQGIFRFLFWRYGQWTEMVVDDLLPTVNGHLVFIRSASGQEFWSVPLEKAYAK